MKQKIILFLFVLLMAFVVAGCGKDDGEANADADHNEAENKTDDKSKGQDDDKEPKELVSIKTDNEHPQDEDETSDDDLQLRQIFGMILASGEIEYDEDKEYYVVEMFAGLSNHISSQDVKEKWVAFALPDGVTVPNVEDVPSGMVMVTLPDDHMGVAFKVPNVKGMSEQSYTVELPLVGEPDDNDPNENLYLYNVDVNQERAELIGEIRSTRKIDFSKMKEK